jgi:hypothetical protein
MPNLDPNNGHEQQTLDLLLQGIGGAQSQLKASNTVADHTLPSRAPTRNQTIGGRAIGAMTTDKEA